MTKTPSHKNKNHHRKVAVIGAGSWGTTFAKVLTDAGCDVTIWARRQEIAHEINVAKRNSKYVSGINLPKQLKATHVLKDAVKGASQIYLAVPAQTLRQNLLDLEPFLSNKAVLISLMKGVERETMMRMSEVIHDTLDLDEHRIAVVSGPNISLEIAREQPTAAVVSSRDLETAQEVALASSTPYFRTFVNNDVTGTELGGVLKNLIALAIGIVDGVGYGENTKASIITRGLVEMTDFAVAFGAESGTLQGLAGMGDLIATCQSPLSRNNTAGRLIGQGFTKEETIAQMQQTAEGVASVGPVLELARLRGVNMPIVQQVEMVLRGQMSPQELGPHLATADDVLPQPENPQSSGRRTFWRNLITKKGAKE